MDEIINERKEVEKMVQDMNSIVEKQEKRIRSLQSNAFELANFYFVFQGVILTAISRAPTSSVTCSDHRRLLLALSSLATGVNLFALFTIGRMYTNALSQQRQNRLEHQEAFQRLHQLRSGSRSRSTRPSDSENSSNLSRDRWEEAKGYFVFAVCMLLFLGFAGVTIAGCWVIPCSRKFDCRRLYEKEDQHCINLCEGPKCIRVCSGY